MSMLNIGILGSTVTSSVTGTQNDYAPAGLTFAPYVTSVITLNPASDVTFTGIAGGVDNAFLLLQCFGGNNGNIFTSHDNAGSSASNRFFNIVNSAPSPHAAGFGRSLYRYEAGSVNRWRQIFHLQGNPISPVFSSGDYTASAGNWTLTAGDRVSGTYFLIGRKLFVDFTLTTTTVSATPSGLRVNKGAYGGFNIDYRILAGGPIIGDNSTTFVAGQVDANPANGYIIISRLDGSNFATSTDNTYVNFQFQIPVN